MQNTKPNNDMTTKNKLESGSASGAATCSVCSGSGTTDGFGGAGIMECHACDNICPRCGSGVDPNGYCGMCASDGADPYGNE